MHKRGQFVDLSIRTFSLLFAERHILKKPCTKRSPKIQALEYPKPDTVKANMGVQMGKK